MLGVLWKLQFYKIFDICILGQINTKFFVFTINKRFNCNFIPHFDDEFINYYLFNFITKFIIFKLYKL